MGDGNDLPTASADALRACLNDFVWAYANVDGESDDLLFQVWLRARALLRLNLPEPPRARTS